MNYVLYAIITIVIALFGFALGLHIGEKRSNEKYEKVLKEYVSVGNTKIINCYEILYGRMKR